MLFLGLYLLNLISRRPSLSKRAEFLRECAIFIVNSHFPIQYSDGQNGTLLLKEPPDQAAMAINSDFDNKS